MLISNVIENAYQIAGWWIDVEGVFAKAVNLASRPRGVDPSALKSSKVFFVQAGVISEN